MGLSWVLPALPRRTPLPYHSRPKKHKDSPDLRSAQSKIKNQKSKIPSPTSAMANGPKSPAANSPPAISTKTKLLANKSSVRSYNEIAWTHLTISQTHNRRACRGRNFSISPSLPILAHPCTPPVHRHPHCQPQLTPIPCYKCYKGDFHFPAAPSPCTSPFRRSMLLQR